MKCSVVNDNLCFKENCKYCSFIKNDSLYCLSRDGKKIFCSHKSAKHIIIYNNRDYFYEEFINLYSSGKILDRECIYIDISLTDLKQFEALADRIYNLQAFS